MSTLTKILIVLLTISSIFLCGIVVTYVGSAENYKTAYDDQKHSINSKQLRITGLEDDFNSYKEKSEQNIAALNNTIDKSEALVKQLTTELGQKDIEINGFKAQLQANDEKVADITKTVQMNTQLRKDLDAKIAELEALKTKSNQQINALTTQIVSKDVLIDRYEAEKKKLIEEKTKLQDIVDKGLQGVGQTYVGTNPVIAPSDPANAAPPVRELDLEGRIREVKPDDSLVSISLGSADGVKQGMKFHVLRGDKFICDIGIFSVDADQASGYFDLIGEEIPRAGDVVKTNF